METKKSPIYYVWVEQISQALEDLISSSKNILFEINGFKYTDNNNFINLEKMKIKLANIIQVAEESRNSIYNIYRSPVKLKSLDLYLSNSFLQLNIINDNFYKIKIEKESTYYVDEFGNLKTQKKIFEYKKFIKTP